MLTAKENVRMVLALNYQQKDIINEIIVKDVWIAICNKNIDLIFNGPVDKYYIISSQDLCGIIENHSHKLCIDKKIIV